MSWMVIVPLVLFLILLAAGFGLRRFTKSIAQEVRDDPEYQAEIARLHESYEKERTVREEAPWFGTTGLDDEVERELPKYLRREFGELLLDNDSLKAADLVYVGKFKEEDSVIHYWRIPPRNGEVSFACVEVGAQGELFTDWGGREPPSGSKS